MIVRFFLNPIQFIAAAREAGFSHGRSDALYREALTALNTLSAQKIEEGTPRPLPLRPIPATARSPLREALERQNADRAAAVEVQLLDNVFVTFCVGMIADVRVEPQTQPAPAPTPV